MCILGSPFLRLTPSPGPSLFQGRGALKPLVDLSQDCLEIMKYFLVVKPEGGETHFPEFFIPGSIIVLLRLVYLTVHLNN